ncbi:DUF3379 family protein [Glaciecola sp. 1036]|uniref:DUF3379 family protein n=1 Tax=Alteromonadaceae TaxID=72275 RepID=UPI003D05E824
MDDLTFRRTVYADPFTQDKEVIQAAQDDPKKQAFWEEVKEMESAIEQAMNIPVPDNLSEKLLLKQSIGQEKKEQKRKRWVYGMAASVAVTAMLSFSYMRYGTSISATALTHIDHADYEVANYGPVDLQTVNAKLVNFNGHLENGLDNMLSANFCYLNTVKSLHIIVQGKEGLLSLFILPQDVTDPIDAQFSNEELSGVSFLLESTRLLVVGENEEEINSLAESAKQLLSFSA